MEKELKRSYIREILDAINEQTISFAGGLPDDSLFPLEQLKEASNKVFESSKCLQYSKSIGDDNLREKIAEIYTKYLSFPTTKDEVLITTGSQQAFDIISKTFIDKSLFVQSPTYIGALGSFKILDKEIYEYKNLSSLKKSLEKNDCVYIMSDFSNPTTKSISAKKREDYAKVINEKKTFLIEDGAYSLLSFDGKLKIPLASKVKNSFHLGSFSKIVAPGLRVGWIRTSKENISKLLIAKESLDLHTSTLSQMIINQYLEDNKLFEHIAIIRKEYEKKMKFMAKCLKRYLPSFSFKRPKGGMFIYGEFEENSFILAKKVLEKNVAFVPAQVFFKDEKESNFARFNYTNSTFEEIERGIKIISTNINK